MGEYPKLPFAGNPGGLISPAFAESFSKGLKNCRVVQLSSGIHYLQEDHPEVIGTAVKEWLSNMGVDSSRKHKVALRTAQQSPPAGKNLLRHSSAIYGVEASD